MSPSRRLCDVEEPGVRSQAARAERTQIRLRRRGVDVEARQRRDAAERLGTRADDGVLAPAGAVSHDVARGEARCA